MSEKDRDEITGMLTKRGIEDLGAPWLAMAEAPPQVTPYLPPLPGPYRGLSKTGEGDTASPFSLEGGGVGSIDSRKQRPQYDWQTRLRYGRSF